MFKVLFQLLATVAGVCIILIGMVVVSNLVLGQPTSGLGEVILYMLTAMGLLLISGLAVIAVLRWRYPLLISRSNPDPRIVPDAAVYDSADLLIAGLTWDKTVIIQHGMDCTEIPSAAVRAVRWIPAQVRDRREHLEFAVDDTRMPVLRRPLQLWDRGQRRRNDVAALLGLR
jgi:hypothetical protein